MKTKLVVNASGTFEAAPGEELSPLLTMGLRAFNGEESAFWETFFSLLRHDPDNEIIPHLDVREFRTVVMDLKKTPNLNPGLRLNLEIMNILCCYKGFIPGYHEDELWLLFKTVENQMNQNPLLLFLAAQLAVDSYNKKPGPETEAVAQGYFTRLLSWFSNAMRVEQELTIDTPREPMTQFNPAELNAEMMAYYAAERNFIEIPRLLCEMEAYGNNVGVQYLAFVLHTRSPYQNPPEKAINLPLLQPELFLRIHDYYARSGGLLTLEQRIALRKTYWPDQAIIERKLKLNEASQMILLDFLIEDAVLQLNTADRLTHALVNEVCDLANAQLKQVVDLKCEGAETQQYRMDLNLAGAVLGRRTSEGPKFSLGCALLLRYPSSATLQVNLVRYLMREDISEAFPGEDKVQLIVTLLCLPDAALLDQRVSGSFFAFIKDHVQPFIEKEGCGEKVLLAGSSEYSGMRLRMVGLEKEAMLAMRRRFEEYVNYRAATALSEERAALRVPQVSVSLNEESPVLSLAEFSQKAPIIEAIHQSCIATENRKKGRTALGGFFNKTYRSKIDENQSRLLALATACESADEDRSISAERVIDFLKDEKTLLDRDSPAFCLMQNLSPAIGFNFQQQWARLKHSPNDLRDAFCVTLDVTYLEKISSLVTESYVEEMKY